MQTVFRRYYEELTMTRSVPVLENREFGFASFEGRMIRHQSFRNEEQLVAFLRDFAPRDAYVSCGYYEDPIAEMEKKGWLGADLVFDIDADHIPTDCDKYHDEWACGNCSFTGRGIVPEKCPVCGGEKFDVSTWPCETCLASARNETVKLLDMLMHDFGFSQEEVAVFFSGHRGYHVHVESESVKRLDSTARKEIVDYICGLGLDLSLGGLGLKDFKTTKRYQGLHSGKLGWSERISAGMKDVILNANDQSLLNIGVGRKEARVLLSNKDRLLRGRSDTSVIGGVKGVGVESWRKIAEHSVKTKSAKVDTVVTTDIHRLIRLQGTLHGKTGFKKVEFPVSALDDFDPFRSAIAFKEGEITVLISKAPEFRLGDEMFGPYKGEKVELPTVAAILLICRGRAEVVK